MESTDCLYPASCIYSIYLNLILQYLQYFGGTNFGRTAGGPFYITSYDYDSPIDEYGRYTYIGSKLIFSDTF